MTPPPSRRPSWSLKARAVEEVTQFSDTRASAHALDNTSDRTASNHNRRANSADDATANKPSISGRSGPNTCSFPLPATTSRKHSSQSPSEHPIDTRMAKYSTGDKLSSPPLDITKTLAIESPQYLYNSNLRPQTTLATVMRPLNLR